MNILQGIAFIGGPIMSLIIIIILINWIRWEKRMKKIDYILDTKLGYSRKESKKLLR